MNAADVFRALIVISAVLLFVRVVWRIAYPGAEQAVRLRLVGLGLLAFANVVGVVYRFGDPRFNPALPFLLLGFIVANIGLRMRHSGDGQPPGKVH